MAVAAALAVLEPCSTGLGGDMFALWYDSRTSGVSAVNGSGRSPSDPSLRDVVAWLGEGEGGGEREELLSRFRGSVHSVTVPGAAAGWEDVRRKFGSGRLSLAELLKPAIELAEGGFPVSPLTSAAWRSQMGKLARWHTEEEIAGGVVELGVGGGASGPMPGELFRNPGMAAVLRSLEERGAADGFYGGFPGRAIVEALRRHGGLMTMDDMRRHASSFPDPVRVEYRGVHVWEVPPNGQGVAGLIALEGLRSLEECGMIPSPGGPPDRSGSTPRRHRHPQASCEMLHAQIEMMRLGFGDARAHVCDPDFVAREEGTTDWLLDKNRIRERAAGSFDGERAVIRGGPDSTSCTVSFQVVDGEGNAMSFVNRCVRFFVGVHLAPELRIFRPRDSVSGRSAPSRPRPACVVAKNANGSSNYMGFGTGITPADCGFTLQNRGAGFSLDPSHPNALKPNKRPYHTIIPAMLMHADTGELYATLSNMGGFMQPQGHMQLVVNLLAYGMDPQVRSCGTLR